MPARYLALRVLTEERLHSDVPLDVDSRLRELSAPGALTATVAPDIGQLRDAEGRLILEKWGTILLEEVEGIIRWGGLVVDAGFDGAAWRIECAGMSTYPHGMAFTGTLELVDHDPADIARRIWQHLQEQPDGNLGIEVVGATDVRIGTPEEDVEFETSDGDAVAFTAGPYRLDWEDTPDCGREIDQLARETPFDWVEHHDWIDREAGTVRHWIEIAPALGRKRTDLSFVQGVNIIRVVTPSVDGDRYASEVIGIGAGEGAKALRSTAAIRNQRLRRTHVVTAKDVTSEARLRTVVNERLAARSESLRIDSIEIRDHPHAPIEAIGMGDLIRVDATLPWLGTVQQWMRVVAVETLDRGARAIVHLTYPAGG